MCNKTKKNLLIVVIVVGAIIGFSLHRDFYNNFCLASSFIFDLLQVGRGTHNRKLIPRRKIGSKFLVFVVFPVLLLICKIRN